MGRSTNEHEHKRTPAWLRMAFKHIYLVAAVLLVGVACGAAQMEKEMVPNQSPTTRVQDKTSGGEKEKLSADVVAAKNSDLLLEAGSLLGVEGVHVQIVGKAQIELIADLVRLPSKELLILGDDDDDDDDDGAFLETHVDSRVSMEDLVR